MESMQGEDGGDENSHSGHTHDQEGEDNVGNVVFKSAWCHPVDVAEEDSIGDEEGDEEGDLLPKLWWDEEHQAVDDKHQSHGPQNAVDVKKCACISI